MAERLEEGTYRFGPFRLAPDGRLLRGGRTVPLAPKPLAVLQLLVGSPGRVVSKREILEQVWAGEDVGEASLTSCIHGLRDALGDRRRRGRYLETVHGRGYRFTSNVERVGTSGPAPVRWRVAIAPFDDESRSPAYLSEGFLDDVISRLGRWHASGIDAIARSSTARLLAAHGDLLRLARALRLDFLVTGRLRADARELRGAAELIRSRDGVVVWSRDFTSPADGRALLAGEIAEAVAKELIELRGGEPVAEPAPAPALDPRSHRALLRGQFLNQFRTDSGLRRSIRCFEQALEWDPRFTAAHVALAEAYLNLGWRGYAAPLEIGAAARTSVVRALESDGRHVGALSVLAFLRMFLDWDAEGADDALAAATDERSEDDRNAWHRSMVQVALGRFDAAQTRVESALEIDPLSPNLAIARFLALWWGGRSEDALAAARDLTATEPEFATAHAAQGAVAASLVRFDEALRAASRGDTLARGDQLARSTSAWAFAVAGAPERARAILATLERRARTRYVSPSFLAILSEGLGDRRACQSHLERAHALRDMWFPMVGVDSRLAGLRGDPRLGAPGLPLDRFAG